MKKLYLALLFILFQNISFSQSLEDLDNYTVDQFYKKIELDYGTLDENGHQIDYIYVRTDVDQGEYKIELSDGDGDLYEINDTALYVSLNGYFGYAGYSTECLMKVNYYSAIIYKLD